MKPTQLTSGPYGHTLNATQVFSPDDQWVVYDTRNEDPHISRTGRIEKVNVSTGAVDTVYTTQHQSLHGPGVGAVAWHPVENKIIFIHGLLNCTEQNPYGFTRRFGAIVSLDTPVGAIHAEARRLDEPLLAGALRGGTHAHTWSGDGAWISFTYNDYLLEQLEKQAQGPAKDLRTIGVMAPGPVKTPLENAEEFSGTYFTVVAATVTEQPAPGTDEIERAFDECWIGVAGYGTKDGARQRRAIAFQGNVRHTDGSLVTEVFVADLPEDIRKAAPGRPLEGTLRARPHVPLGLTQRRITFTAEKKYPGVQGSRMRLRTSPDGSTIYFPMKDDDGVVQIFSVPTVGGTVRQITHFSGSLQAQFNVSPDGSRISAVVANRIWVVNIADGTATPVTEPATDEDAPVGGALWNHAGKMLVFNRYVGSGDSRWLQIFTVAL